MCSSSMQKTMTTVEICCNLHVNLHKISNIAFFLLRRLRRLHIAIKCDIETAMLMFIYWQIELLQHEKASPLKLSCL